MIRRSGAAALAVALLAGAALTASGSSSATSASSSGLPLYQFVRTLSGPLPWTATSLTGLLGGVTLAAGPLSTLGPQGQSVAAFSTASHEPAFIETLNKSMTFTNLSSVTGIPAASTAPTPFFDHAGHLNLAYVATNGHVILVTNDPQPASGDLGPGERMLHRDWLVHDLSRGPSGSLAAPASHVSALAQGSGTLVALRTPAGALVQVTVPDQHPFIATTSESVATGISSDPVYAGPLSDGVVTLAAITTGGHLCVYRHLPTTWQSTDITGGLSTPALAGTLAATSTGNTLFIVGLQSASDAVDLATGVLGSGVIKWTHSNLTALTSGAAVPGPALSGRITITVSASTLQVAGAAAGWGDLFDYTGTFASSKWTWAVTDVSATGGSNAKTVASEVAAATSPAGATTFLAGGVATPAPHGVGVYAIPQGYLRRSISDGWRLLGDTGGLGTTSAPWVKASWSPVSSSPDFTTGLAIQNSHHRVTWMSFWTVSGPSGSELVAPATFHAHAFSAGAAIATEIDSYRANGLGLKPDWVILDPEGYPDLHSGVDSLSVSSIVGNGRVAVVTTSAPSAISVGMKINISGTGYGSLNITGATVTSLKGPATFTVADGFTGKATSGRVVAPALVHADWASFLAGWQAGITSVDPTLKPAIYADESEYQSSAMSSIPIPVFLAIAWVPPSSPQPISHTSNVLGYVEWGNGCNSGNFQKQLAMLTSPPWNGQYNTVQFNPGAYCPPSAP